MRRKRGIIKENKIMKLKTENPTTETLTNCFQEIIQSVGENTEREGLVKTPLRAAKAMQFLTHGYQMDPEAILKSAMFQEQYSG